jgi:thymidylate synthase
MKQYYDLLQKIMETGNPTNDRTGVGTLSLFGEQLKFNLQSGFPLLTGKFTSFKTISNELLWFLNGYTNNEDLRKLNGNDKPTIWEEWSTPSGDLGPIYGKQWRNWGAVPIPNMPTESMDGIDQIENLIRGLKERPFSRRHIISAWNVADLPSEELTPQENVESGKMALAPCHAFVQFGVRELSFSERAVLYVQKYFGTHFGLGYDRDYENLMNNVGVPKYGLSCHLYQRSADIFLGVPYNIASYALFTEILGNLTNMLPENLIISFGDVHLYKNHINQTKELLSRNLAEYALPTLVFNDHYNSIDEINEYSYTIKDYRSLGSIKAEVAV